MGIFDQELHLVLSSFARSYIRLEDFKEWLATSIWRLLESTSPLDRMVIGELQLALNAHDEGTVEEEAVRQQAEAMIFILDSVRLRLEGRTTAIAA